MDNIATAAAALSQALDQSNGDEPASQQDGQPNATVKMVPEPKVVKEATKTKTEQNQDSKKQRISQKEWQETKEKANSADEVAEELENAPKSVKQEEDLAAQVRALKEEAARSKWEAKHPRVLREDMEADWEKVVKNKGHLVQSGDLTYDDLYSLIRKGNSSKIKEELEIQESEPLTPVASNSTRVGTRQDNALAKQFLRETGNTKLMKAAEQLD